MVGQLHGAMPVIGVSSRSSSDLHFKWKSFRTIYAVIVAFILSSYSLLLLWKIITNPTYLNISRWSFCKLKCRKNMALPPSFVGLYLAELFEIELLRRQKGKTNKTKEIDGTQSRAKACREYHSDICFQRLCIPISLLIYSLILNFRQTI